jgi:hypothetical protein
MKPVAAISIIAINRKPKTTNRLTKESIDFPRNVNEFSETMANLLRASQAKKGTTTSYPRESQFNCRETN